MSDLLWLKVLLSLSFAALVLLNQYLPPDKLGGELICCFSISSHYYHTVSLVSRSNRSGLRSLVQAGIRARVSVRAHHSSANLRTPSLHILLHSSLPCSGFIMLFTLQALHFHSFHSEPTIVFMHCATLSGTLHRWGFTRLYCLICWARLYEEERPCVFPLLLLLLLFFFFLVFFSSFSLSHSPLATAKYLPTLNISFSTLPWTEIVLDFSF